VALSSDWLGKRTEIVQSRVQVIGLCRATGCELYLRTRAKMAPSSHWLSAQRRDTSRDGRATGCVL
jgi:hypothetical protein